MANMTEMMTKKVGVPTARKKTALPPLRRTKMQTAAGIRNQ